MRNNRRVLVVLVALLGLVFGGAIAADAALFDPVKYAEQWLARIKVLEKEGKFAQAENQANMFVTWTKGVEKKYPKVTPLIKEGYNTQANAEAKQGKYNEAANTTRAQYAWKADSALIEKVMKFEQNDLDQRTFYNKSVEFHQKVYENRRKINGLLQEKYNLTKALLANKTVTKEQLEKLQTQLKDLSKQVADLRATNKDLQEQFAKDTEAFKKDEIVFTATQNSKVNALAKKAADQATANGKLETAGNELLVKVSEKYQMSWDGLEEKLGKMKDAQLKAMDLQKELLALFDQKPLTDDAKKKIKDLKEQLDKLMGEHNQLLADIEKAFMDTKTFNKLTIDQQRKYMEMFRVIREATTVITKTNAIIDKKIEEMNRKFGDLNGDGKIDKTDLAIIVRHLVGIRPMIHPWNPNPAADLDGDGNLSWADYNLLREAVFGDRKFFPVDPEAPKGDMNGDGSFDNDDLMLVVRIMSNPKAFAASLVKLADLNGDGKVDYSDITDLIKKIQEQDKPVVGDPPTTQAPVEAPVDPSAQGTGAQTGNTTGTTGTGEAPNNLNQTY
jgi:Holliday junction resolvasome RuvABC endonuclease subunit